MLKGEKIQKIKEDIVFLRKCATKYLPNLGFEDELQKGIWNRPQNNIRDDRIKPQRLERLRPAQMFVDGNMECVRPSSLQLCGSTMWKDMLSLTKTEWKISMVESSNPVINIKKVRDINNHQWHHKDSHGNSYI